MPVCRKYNYRYRKRYAGRRKKRFYKKRDKLSTTRVNLSTGIPDKMMMKMKYVQRLSLEDVTGGLSQYYTFRGNSIYDPDYSSGSLLDKQPISYDQWTPFYKFFRVFASKIEIEVFNYNTTAKDSSVCLVAIPTNTPISTTISTLEAKCNPYAKYIVLAAASGGPQRKIVNYMTTKKICGDETINDATYYGGLGGIGTGGNPGLNWYWNVAAVNVNAVEDFTIMCMVTITYYVELSNRKHLGLSN